MRRFHFSTIASNNYLYKLIVMYKSLEYYNNDFHLHVLCVDEEVYNILSNLKFKHLKCYKIYHIQDKDLMKAKANRTRQEYAWTLKPAMMYYVMKNFSSAQYYAHIDADICFYSSLENIFNENIDASLYLTDHNNSNRFMDTYDVTGRYNTGFVGCKNNNDALSAVVWWKKQCIKWCYKEPDIKAKLFGDQRYVERWANLFSNVHIVNTKGANVAVWNIDNYHISYRDGAIYVDDDKLIFYHFSGLSIYNSREFNLAWFKGLPDSAVKLIYIPYLNLLSEAIENVQNIFHNFTKGFTRKGQIPDIYYYRL
ncbi:hypothetical protein FQB35_06765 [Crassaminicella thermophila]|uniref:Nucleotide-diphospho-sugar transferase n=1 Tax=Crassaminicella thermophila TaxID=2599308 RepID=A0A5C0SDE7_CRATE|nr:hypothetical protein [Crassaminicella thermophila]QEK12100.1 hypothetical protein FQB35_06765 [Crassaminicella thermophila]